MTPVQQCSGCALAACLAAATLAAGVPRADAAEALASVFAFGPPTPGDPDPTLTGLIKIDLDTGQVDPFLTSAAGGNYVLSDVAIGPHDGLVYVSTLGGTIERYDTQANFVDVFAFFPGPTFPGDPQDVDGVNTLEFTADGTLYAGTANGRVVEYAPDGAPQPDVASGLFFPAGIAADPSGDLFVTTGFPGGPGEVVRITPGGATATVFGGPEIGGGSGVTLLAAAGDYNLDDQTTAADYDAWVAQFGSNGGSADGNGDGLVDGADYTLWRDNEGAESRLLIADLAQDASGNELYEYNLATDTGGQFAPLTLPIPDPLPPGGIPTNVGSEILLTDEGTLLVSTLGPTQRPNNNGALVEYDLDGALLRTIATGLPPLSGIALLPAGDAAVSVPEPTTIGLLALAVAAALRARR